MPVREDSELEISHANSSSEVKCARGKSWDNNVVGSFTEKIACGFIDNLTACTGSGKGKPQEYLRGDGFHLHMIAYHPTTKTFVEPATDTNSTCGGSDKWWDHATGNNLNGDGNSPGADSCADYTGTPPVAEDSACYTATMATGYQVHGLKYYNPNKNNTKFSISTAISGLNASDLKENLNQGTLYIDYKDAADTEPKARLPLSQKSAEATPPVVSFAEDVIPDPANTTCKEGLHYFDLCNLGTYGNKFGTVNAPTNIKEWYKKLCKPAPATTTGG